MTEKYIDLTEEIWRADEGRTSFGYVDGDYSGGNRDPHAEFDRFLAAIKADARRSLIQELLADAELEASIGRQGNDDERVKTAEKVIEMLNDTQVEGEA